jgi:hypothetical protein
MATKKEREEMSKALTKIDNKWEAFAFVWAYRQKEIKNFIIVVQFGIIIGLLIKYTTVFQSVWNFIKGVVK